MTKKTEKGMREALNEAVDAIEWDNQVFLMTNEELQKAIEVLLTHAGKEKKRWWGSLGNDHAFGAISDCLGRMLYEQVKRAGCHLPL